MKYVGKFLDRDEIIVFGKDQISIPGFHNNVDLSKITNDEELKIEQNAARGPLVFNFDGLLISKNKNGYGVVKRLIFLEFKATTADIIYKSINYGVLRLAALKQGVEENAGKNWLVRNTSIEYLLITKRLNESQKAEIRAAGALYVIPVHILENYDQIEADFLKVAHF